MAGAIAEAPEGWMDAELRSVQAKVQTGVQQLELAGVDWNRAAFVVGHSEGSRSVATTPRGSTWRGCSTLVETVRYLGAGTATHGGVEVCPFGARSWVLDEVTDKPDQDGGLPEIAKQVGDLVTGLPLQAQRNFWKAVGRVLTGMAEWPAAYFEGRAAKTRAKWEAEAAGIRAQQRADETVLLGTAEAAARQFGADPELARRAVEHHAAEIVRGQVSLEATLRVTAEELNASPPEEDAAEEIEDDWLTAFVKEASTKSNEEVRLLFGKILAGEVRAPGSFSIRTMQSVGLLTQRVAQTFQVLCNLSVKLEGHDGKVITDPFGNAGDNALQQFGLDYTNLTSLTECDLIHPDFNESMTVSANFYENRAPFDYAGMTVWLAAAQDADASKLPSPIIWRGPRLTTVGKELRQVVSMEHVPAYTAKLKEWLRSQQLVMYQVTQREGGRLCGKPL